MNKNLLCDIGRHGHSHIENALNVFFEHIMTDIARSEDPSCHRQITFLKIRHTGRTQDLLSAKITPKSHEDLV